ncbi:MAG: ABC transporter permease [Proteobacteria bacterium]|nr:MAG: ABC transporter permease [Pseudomonadota bacterium]
MKTLLQSLLLATFAMLSAVPGIADEKFVAVTQIVEHPALDSVREGVKDALKEQGFEQGKNLRWMYESAQGNPTIAAQIAKKLAGAEPDVIVAIATPSAQTVAATAKHTPIVFSAVTDPVGAKLVKQLKQPGKNITGVTDSSPIDKHVDLMLDIVPDTKTIGTIYNPGEANSVTLVKMLEASSGKKSIKLKKAAATKTADVLAAARSLAGKVDVIYLPTDNTVISALEAVVKVCRQNKIPLVAGDTDSVSRGAVAALSFNYYDIGKQTGRVVAQILNGTAPGSIDVRGIENLDLHLNLKSARQMGVTLSRSLRDRASKVIED